MASHTVLTEIKRRSSTLTSWGFSPNISPGTLILPKLLLPAPRPCGSCLCWSARSDWKSLSGEFNTAAQRCLSCGLCAIPFISLSYALYDPAAEKRRQGGREGREKKNPTSPGLAWRGWIPQENSCDKGAQRSNLCITPLNSKDTGARKSGRRGMCVSGRVRQEIHFVLTVACVCFPQMCTQGQIHNLRGWDNMRYLFNYELDRVWSWCSESWSWILNFSPLRVQCTPPNTG